MGEMRCGASARHRLAQGPPEPASGAAPAAPSPQVARKTAHTCGRRSSSHLGSASSAGASRAAAIQGLVSRARDRRMKASQDLCAGAQDSAAALLGAAVAAGALSSPPAAQRSAYRGMNRASSSAVPRCALASTLPQ